MSESRPARARQQPVEKTYMIVFEERRHRETGETAVIVGGVDMLPVRLAANSFGAGILAAYKCFKASEVEPDLELPSLKSSPPARLVLHRHLRS